MTVTVMAVPMRMSTLCLFVLMFMIMMIIMFLVIVFYINFMVVVTLITGSRCLWCRL